MESQPADWNVLLADARDILSGGGLDERDWVWGGGTVLMLRYGHRASRDIDLFLNDPQLLTYFTPRLNDRVAGYVDDYTEAANHLRLVFSGKGEIDLLVVAPVIDTSSWPMDVEGHGVLRTMPDREILAQKLHYRAGSFTGRDLFDLVTVAEANPSILDDPALMEVGHIRRNALSARLSAPDMEAAYNAIVPLDANRRPPDFDYASALLGKWLERCGPRPNEIERPSPGPD